MKTGLSSGVAAIEILKAVRAPFLGSMCRPALAWAALQPMRLRSTQQPSSDHEQVGKAGGDLQAMRVLGQSSVSHLLESEHPLDHPDAVLDFRAHTGLAAVHGADALIDPTAPAIPLIGEVLGSPGHRAHDGLLAAIGLVAPH